MTQETKDRIIRALKTDLGNARDNLCRAKAAFHGLSEAEMNLPYGHSPDSKRQIVAGYQSWADEAQKALDEAEVSL